MAATVTALGTLPANAIVPGSRRHLYAKVAFDNSYPTGGYALTAAACGLAQIDAVLVSAGTLAGRLASWAPSTGKVKVWSALTTEVANTTDLSADSVQVHVIGA